MADFVTLSQLVSGDDMATTLDVAGMAIPAHVRAHMIPASAISLPSRIRAATTNDEAGGLLDECAEVVVAVVADWKLCEDGPKPGVPGPVMELSFARIRRLPTAVLAELTSAVLSAPTLKKTTLNRSSRRLSPTKRSHTGASLNSSGLKVSRTGLKK